MFPLSRAGRIRELFRSYWTPAGKQALGNLIGLVACTGISQACALGVLLVLTYGLPQEGFGAVIFALNLQSYLVAVGTFGLTAIVVRDLTLHPDKSAETITAYLTVVSVASVLVGVATAVTAAFLPISPDERVMLWCIAAGNVAACLNLNPLFDAAHKQALAAALMVPGDLLAVGMIAGAYLADALSVQTAGVALIGRVATTAILHAIVFRRVWPFAWKRNGGRAWRLMRSGWPMLFSGLIYAVPLGGSVVFVRALSGEIETSIYGLAFQLVTAELMIVSLILRVLQPHISGEYGLTRRFQWQLLAVVGGTLLGLIGLMLAAGWVLIFQFLRPEYESVYPVLAVLQGMVVFFAAAAVANLYLIRFHREGWIQAAHVIAVAVYLALVLGGWSRYHLGYAFATTVSSVLLLVVAAFGLRARVATTSFPDGDVTA